MKSPILSCAMVLTFSGALNAVYADSATWSLNPISKDWNTAANWMPPTVPNGSADTATFGVSNVLDPRLRFRHEAVEVNGIVFTPERALSLYMAGSFLLGIAVMKLGALA